MKKLKVAIRSFGCQMNEYDGEVAAGLLEKAGFHIMRHPERHVFECGKAASEGSMSEILRPSGPQGDSELPDVILMNTCSVRGHAEERVFSRLGMLGKVKRTR